MFLMLPMERGLGLRRSGSSSQFIDPPQDFPKQVPGHGDFGQLERDVLVKHLPVLPRYAYIKGHGGAKTVVRRVIDRLSKLIQQCLSLLQIGRVEPLGEPGINRRQKISGLCDPVVVSPHTSEAGGRAQLR